MSEDEIEIRRLVETWHKATKAGDTAMVLSLMTDDVIFLLPGRAPMRKEEFATLSRPLPNQPQPKFEGISDIQEVVVSGDLAYLWSKLAVKVTPPNGNPPIERAGHTLTVFRKERGKWLLARDANLLVKLNDNQGE